MKTAIQTRDAPEAIGTYSQAVRADDTVYLSGQIGLDPATMQLAEGIDGQTHRVFRNLAAVAAAAGCSLDQAVRMTVYLTDLAHFARVNEIMAQYVREPFPARAALWSRSTLSYIRGEACRCGVKTGSAREQARQAWAALAPRLCASPAAALRGLDGADRTGQRAVRKGGARRGEDRAGRGRLPAASPADRARRRRGAALFQFLRQPAEAVPARGSGRLARAGLRRSTRRLVRRRDGASALQPRARGRNAAGRPDADLSDDRRARASGIARADPRCAGRRAAGGHPARAAARHRYGGGVAAREIRRAPRAAAVDALCVPEAPLPPGARIEDKRRSPQVFPEESAFHADPRADAHHERSAARCIGTTPDAEASARRRRQRQDDRRRDRLPRRGGRRLAGRGDGADRDPVGAAFAQVRRMACTSRPEDRLVAWGTDEKAEGRGAKGSSRHWDSCPGAGRRRVRPSRPRRGR